MVWSRVPGASMSSCALKGASRVAGLENRGKAWSSSSLENRRVPVMNARVDCRAWSRVDLPAPLAPIRIEVVLTRVKGAGRGWRSQGLSGTALGMRRSKFWGMRMEPKFSTRNWWIMEVCLVYIPKVMKAQSVPGRLGLWTGRRRRGRGWRAACYCVVDGAAFPGWVDPGVDGRLCGLAGEQEDEILGAVEVETGFGRFGIGWEAGELFGHGSVSVAGMGAWRRRWKAVQEGAGAVDFDAEPGETLAEGGIGGVDGQGAGSWMVPGELDDAVICAVAGVGAAVEDAQEVVARRVRGRVAVKDDCPGRALGFGQGGDVVGETAGGGFAVAPPAVGAGSEDVVAVDDDVMLGLAVGSGLRMSGEILEFRMHG